MSKILNEFADWINSEFTGAAMRNETTINGGTTMTTTTIETTLPKYIPSAAPDYGTCRFSGRPRLATRAQAQAAQEARLAALSGTDGIVSFCTNTMLSRGTIYVCRIDTCGHAIAYETYRWWAMAFSERKPCDMDLGLVVVGDMGHSLAVGQYQEGQG